MRCKKALGVAQESDKSLTGVANSPCAKKR